jgi:hypothetical protein
MLVAATSWVWGEMLNNIYVVLFIKGRIVLSVWPIYTLLVFRLTLCIHNKQIIQNCSLLFVVDFNYFNSKHSWYHCWRIKMDLSSLFRTIFYMQKVIFSVYRTLIYIISCMQNLSPFANQRL